MDRTFRPQRSILVTIILFSYGIAGFMFWTFVYSGNSADTLILPFIITFGMATAYTIAASSSRITIKDDILSTVTFVFSRHTTPIADILSVTFLSNYAGFGEGLEIHYRGKVGFNRVMRIGIGAYGLETAKIVLNVLRKRNPNIKFDHRVDNLAR